jgi:cysteine-S-conjugate beta-lyase
MTKKPDFEGGHAGLDPASLRPDTRLVVGGRDPFAHHGFVNPPVYHASTVLYRTAEEMIAHRARYVYGRRGTPTSEALEAALRDLEGPQCAGVALLPSGLAAISLALLSVLRAGDNVLVADNVYRPTRTFCDSVLTRFGISLTYYDSLGDISGLFRAETQAIFVEAPGSQSFEMPDVPALAATAHANGAVVLMDNTWATPLYFRALDKGVDLSIQAATKYVGGHSDVMLGAVAANAATWERLREAAHTLGLCVGPDDIYLGLRGLRTLGVRLGQHQQSALRVAQWLAQRPEVARVLHPALDSCPGHAVWRRDFSGASGLFSIVFKPLPEAAVNAFLNELSLFGMGASWGGFESLAVPFDCAGIRTATNWAPGGPAVRLHIGLEDVDDLIGDLERGFAALVSAA